MAERLIRTRGKRFRGSRAGLLGLAPALLWTSAFFLVPMVIMLAYSFFTFTDFRVETTLTLDNYRQLFTETRYHSALGNSLMVTTATVVVSIVLAFPLACVIAFKIPRRFQLLCLALIIIPFWTSYVVRSYSWLTVLSGTGVMNKVLMGLHITAEPIDLVYTPTATVLGFVHFFLMLLTLTIYSSLVQISPSYVRAARDLGAGNLRVLLEIILPLALPGILVGTLLTIILALGDYVTPAILGGNTDLVLPQALVLEVSSRADFPQAASIGVMMMVMLLAVFLAFSRYVKVTDL